MVQQVMIEIAPEVHERLAQLPTATTPGERQLALHYVATQWDGKADIFENGPLLGGATRALAMGMQFNKKRDPETLIHTYDWFSFREDNPLDVPDGAFLQLIAAGLLTPEEVETARRQGTFLPVFRSLHRGEDYWQLVRPHVGYLPGHRGDVPPEGPDAIFHPFEEREFSLAFVDGCKSWFGTKHWFRELAPRLRPGADLLFQDYGHYTCFWISSLIGTFPDRFELIAYVDHTYVWRLHQAPTVKEIDDFFPDEPEGVSRDTFDSIYDALLKDATDRGDRYCIMIHQAHRAAAYAYIGLKDEAREILDKLLMVAEWFPYRDYLKQARISPTYTPEERIEL